VVLGPFPFSGIEALRDAVSMEERPMMRFGERIDDHLDMRSIHEAGHAIAAVHLGVGFSSSSVERGLLPRTGGYVMIDFPIHRNVRSIESFLIVLFAGASAADYILKFDGAFHDAQIAGDIKQIDSTVAAHRQLIPTNRRKTSVQECRAKADKMVRLPAVEDAIKECRETTVGPEKSVS
jgi:hypothetical protein